MNERLLLVGNSGISMSARSVRRGEGLDLAGMAYAIGGGLRAPAGKGAHAGIC